MKYVFMEITESTRRSFRKALGDPILDQQSSYTHERQSFTWLTDKEIVDWLT